MAYLIWFAWCFFSGAVAGSTHNVTLCMLMVAINVLLSVPAINWLDSIFGEG